MKRLIEICRRFLLWIGAATILLCMGCAKAPDAPAVWLGAEQMISAGTIETAQDSRSIAERVQAPERLDKTITDDSGLLTIVIDADVELPSATAAPIYKVQAADFSQEIVTTLFDRLCAGRAMKESPDGMTKRQIEAEIASWKETAAHASGENLADAQARIAYYESILPSAPEEHAYVPSHGFLRRTERVNDLTGEVVCRYDALNATDGQGFAFWVQNNNDLDEPYAITAKSEIPVRRNASLYVTRVLDESYSQFGQHAIPVITDASQTPAVAQGKLSMTPAEARAIVEALLDGTNMTVANLYVTDDADCGSFDDKVGEAKHYAYLFKCTRQIDGLRFAPIIGSTEDRNGYEWTYEELCVMVEDSGIVYFLWNSPSAIAECLAEDAKLITFAEAMQIFEKTIVLNLDRYVGNGSMERKRTIPISHIELSYVRVYDSDAFDSGIAIPAWTFWGLDYARHDGPEYDGTLRPVMAINAMNGNIIDLERGY